MSKKKRKKNNTTNIKAQSSEMSSNYLPDMLAASLGFLMCTMLLIMLAADAAVAGMYEKQYEIFPSLFRVLNFLAAMTGTTCIVILAFQRKLKFGWAHIFFAAFLLCIALSTAVNGLGEEAIHGISYRNIGVFHMLAFVVLYLGASSMIESNELKDRLLLLYIAIADLMALAVAYDHFGAGIAAFTAKKELSAIFFNGNHYGYFLVMAILAGTGYFLYGEGWKVTAGGISAIANMIVLAVNHSLGCILAVIIVIAAACIAAFRKPEYRKRVWIILGIIAAMAVFGLMLSPSLRREFNTFGKDILAILEGEAKGSVGHNRLKVWRMTAGYISEKPLLGYGCEGMSMMMYAETAISNPHNEILTYAAYYGIPAAVFYVFGVLAVFADHLKIAIRKAPGDDVRSNKEKPKDTVRSINEKHEESCSVAEIAAGLAAAGYFISSISGVAMFYTLPFFFIFLGLSCQKP